MHHLQSQDYYYYYYYYYNFYSYKKESGSSLVYKNKIPTEILMCESFQLGTKK